MSSRVLLSALVRAAGTGPLCTAAPAPVRVVGHTEKVCQLTGDLDWESGRPTAARTLASFGLDAADLGYPVEHEGKLILLFGDSARHEGRAGRLRVRSRARPQRSNGLIIMGLEVSAVHA